MKLSYASLLALLVFCATNALCQNKRPSSKSKSATEQPAPPVKRAITHNDYDGWKSISQRAITPDGAWAAYAITAQDGDGSLILKSLKDNRSQTIDRGSEMRVSYDSELVFYKLKPASKQVKDMRRAKKKREEMPKDSLGIYSFSKNTMLVIPAVQSYKIPEKTGGWVAFIKDPVVAAKDSTKKAPVRGRKAPKKESEENGYTLIIKNLQNNEEKPFDFVTNYEWAKNGKSLAFVTTGDSTLSAGVYVYETEKGTLHHIEMARPKQKFTRLTFDESGTQLAFIGDLDTTKTQIRKPKLFYWRNVLLKASLLADEANNPAQQGWYVSGDYTPTFSKNGNKLFFGTNPKMIVADTSLLPEEVVNVEVWNYKDTRLQTQQKVTLEQDKRRSYAAVIDLTNNQMTQLGSPDIANIETANEGNADWVLATTNKPYSNQHWDWNPKEDAYILNTRTGTKSLIQYKIQGNSRISPTGRFVYWFSNVDTSWVAYNVATKEIRKLTNNRTTRFADEDDDHPDFPNPYGLAGWTQNDAELLLYDKYDIWSVNPETGAILNLTQTGRSQQKTYRYVRLDPEARNIDISKPLLLRMFDNTTKGSGFSYLAVNERTVTEAYKCDCDLAPAVTKAKNADAVLFSKETFKEFPEIWHSDLSFKNLQKVSSVGTQMDSLKWGSVELVNYQATDGTPLQGLLYKPDNFDPTKKYPMLVYFYEKNTENLHNFIAPRPSGSAAPNYAYAVSNGYLVFVPDIVYKIGYPGRSAFNCIMSGVMAMNERGFVDKSRVGVVGHSWGGYQAAYLITQTEFFRAAVPGAPVANMTSAYGGIRWGTGMSRQAQYEFTQSRIGGTLWQKPMQYIENSPLFNLDKVTTPTLILHNDDDDAVPWYQGIEMFMGLKRLEKPTWMLVYNGEKHGNRQRKNQKDFTVRMWQFLDHYLKGSPAPSWMKDGLPMAEKGINQHLETK